MKDLVTRIITDRKQDILDRFSKNLMFMDIDYPEGFTEKLTNDEVTSIIRNILGNQYYARMTPVYGVRQIGLSSDVEHFQYYSLTILKEKK